MPNVKLLVEDGLTTAAGGIPHGGKLVGHGLAQSADLAVAATAASPCLFGGISRCEATIDSTGLDQELVLGMVEGRLAETVVGMEKNLLVTLDEEDAHRLGTAGTDDALIGPDKIPTRLGSFDLEGVEGEGEKTTAAGL